MCRIVIAAARRNVLLPAGFAARVTALVLGTYIPHFMYFFQVYIQV